MSFFRRRMGSENIRRNSTCIGEAREHGDSVIFGSSGGVVREIDPASLEITATVTVPEAVTNAIAFTPNGTRIFVPTYMNEIYAFERS